MRKLLLSLAVLFILVPTLAAQERDSLYAKVCHDIPINLRAQPRTDGAVIGEVANGAKLIILQEEVRDFQNGRWTEVQIEGTDQIGWVYSAYLCFCYESTLRTVSATALNVRTHPNLFSESLGLLTFGETVEVLQYDALSPNNGSWAYIRSQSSGLTGWVMRGYLRGRESACDMPVLFASPETPQEAMIWGYQPVPLFARQDITTAPIATLYNGARLQVIGIGRTASNYWYRVRTSDHQEGWLYDSRTRGSDYFLIYLPYRVRVAESLYVHASPGVDAPRIGQIPGDSCLSVTDSATVDQQGWFYSVEAGGWFAADYAAYCLD